MIIYFVARCQPWKANHDLILQSHTLNDAPVMTRPWIGFERPTLMVDERAGIDTVGRAASSRIPGEPTALSIASRRF